MRSEGVGPAATAGRLAHRVTAAAALGAAIAGALGAAVAGYSARTALERQEDATIVRAATELAEEVRDDVDDLDDLDDLDEEYADYRGAAPPTLDVIVEHEIDDVKLPLARAAIFSGGLRTAGDRSLPPLAPGSCSNFTASEPARACAVPYGQGSLTLAASAQSARAQHAILLRSTIAGLALGALLGMLLSGWAARWAIRPLERLCDDVRLVRIEGPDASSLARPSPFLELEQLRSAIASLVDRLGATLQTARAFSAEAAHELRTPLTAIAGELELLAEEHGGDGAVIGSLRRQVQDLTSLVQRLLVLSREGPIDQAAEAVDLGDVFEAARRELDAQRGSRLRAEIEQDVIVRGDFALLRALLANAIDNALKFGASEVRIAIRHEGTGGRIDVIDDGPGLTPTEREKVFSPFYRAASARAAGTEGHGVGLALIAHVATAHGGSAAFMDRPSAERGAHLCIRLPAWSGAPA